MGLRPIKIFQAGIFSARRSVLVGSGFVIRAHQLFVALVICSALVGNVGTVLLR